MTTAPQPPTTSEELGSSKLFRAAIWVAIGALIAAALVSVVWVIIGTQNGIIGRAFLTILLLAAFGGVAILEAHLAPRRPVWFALVSMSSWVLALLIGAFMTWMPESARSYGYSGALRFFSFLVIVLVLQLALLHVRLYVKAIDRYPTTFTRVVGYITIGLVGLLAIMLVLPLMLNEWLRFHEIYWRLVVAVTILAALGTALVPLVNVLFAPKKPRPEASRAWPTYADGVTPLPILPDGNPDWNAYYTGYPTAYATTAVQIAAPTASPMADAAYAAQPQHQPGIVPSEPSAWNPPAESPVVEQTAPTAHPRPQTPEETVVPQAPVPPPIDPAAGAPGHQGYPPPPPLPPR
ncbi:hypothetical protein [Microbacterium sp. SORGH_AS_0888]|uniref:hypothetical protein n=1 Tax=Microbacterium sp. SORGH_AS_0888 TaxID=3041791 RepID=UPI002784B3B6|nr:hypothetical protein [Microbacterium sp. SORGH_AS_0888]MDQ1130685.1 hypothetical protein [Microbacterium sp. SORGH_AS_0888]